MAQITVEEARTVVEEMERIKCDHCGYVGVDEEFVHLDYDWVGEKAECEFRDLCDNCCNLPEAHQSYLKVQSRRKAIKTYLLGNGMYIFIFFLILLVASSIAFFIFYSF